MSENVVDFRGGVPVLCPFEVCAEAVTVAEKVAEKARSGEVQSVVVVMLHSDGAVTCDYAGPNTYNLVGKLLQVTNHLASEAGNRG